MIVAAPVLIGFATWSQRRSRARMEALPD